MAENTKEELEAELRSVVQSVKGGIPLKSIQGDFRSLTGNFIPFQKFGYSSLEAMIRDMPGVIHLERRFDGELILHAVATETTQHLTALISKQKAGKPRHISKPRRPVRNQSWNPPTPHRSQRNVPSRPPSRNSQNMYRNLPNHSVQSYPRPCLKPISYNVPSQGHSYNQNAGKPPLKTASAQVGGHLGLGSHTAENKSFPGVKSNFEVPPRFQKSPIIQVKIPPVLLPLEKLAPSEWTLPSPVTTPPFSPDAPEFIPRLPPNFSTSIPPKRTQHSPVSTSPPPLEPGLPWPKPRSNKELVDNYAFINGLKCVYRPFENVLKKKHKSLWTSQLILDDQKFVSYPVEMDTAEEANEEAAKRAVEKLKIHPDIISLPIVPTRTPEEKRIMLENVKEIVCENSQGAVHYHVQDQFKKRHRMRLPPNWLEIIQNDELFRLYRADETHFILTYDKSARSTPDLPPLVMNGSSELKSSSADTLEYETYLTEVLPLPESKQWDIYVTHVDNTANICFRLIDSSDEFTEFTQELENHNRRKNLEPVKNPQCGYPYCVFVENSWHRVIVQNISDDGMVLCDFPDVGDSVSVESNVVFPLDKTFLELPFQAFRGELTGLACFANDAVISRKLIECTVGKSLVAEPTERDNNTIALVLYDTSTDDDININKMLLDEVFAAIVPPSLDRTGMLVDGFLGDVLTSGDIFLQISGRSIELLNKLIENISDTLQFQRQENRVTQVVLTEMYCVLYKDQWHRAMPAAADPVSADKVSLLLIDKGIQTDVLLSNLCELDGDNKILSSFPPLALRCHLYGISEGTTRLPEIKAKIAQLVPEGTRLLIKVGSRTTGTQLPVVDLFKRLESSNNELISVNQTLAVFFSLDPEPSESVKNHLERKLSRPNSLQTPTPPPQSPSVIQPSSPTDILSPSDTYSFVETNVSVFGDSTPGSSLDMVSLNKGRHEFCLKSSYSNASPILIPSGCSLVKTSPLSNIPGFPGATLNTENVFSFAPVQEKLPRITPPIAENNMEMGISRQEEIPEIKEYFEVYITSAANPNNFICQSRKSGTATASLFEEMQKFYSCEENICEMHHCLVREGEFYALKHKDEFWYRVYVQDIIQKDPFTMLVFLVDYGGFEMVKLADVQVLYSQFRKLPYQAISASLSGIRAVSGDYTPSNCLEFKNMVEEKNFVSIICAKDEKKQHNLVSTHLSLVLVDTSTPVDVYIHEELIKKNIAIKL